MPPAAYVETLMMVDAVFATAPHGTVVYEEKSNVGEVYAAPKVTKSNVVGVAATGSVLGATKEGCKVKSTTGDATVTGFIDRIGTMMGNDCGGVAL